MGETALVEKPPSYCGYGRPSDLTYELINRIGARVLQGNYPLPSARAEGVPERTFLRWMKQGESDTTAEIATIHAHLWQVIDQKEAEGECDLIHQAVSRKVGWQGPMTVASRRHRERWEDKQSVGGGLTVQIGIALSEAPFASQLSADSVVIHSLSGDVGSDNGGYVVNHQPLALEPQK